MEQPNLNYIHKLSGGNAAFELQLITVLKKEFPLEKEQLKNVVEANKLNEAAELVHKLKHKFSILGLEKSYELAVEYENNLNFNKKEIRRLYSEGQLT